MRGIRPLVICADRPPPKPGAVCLPWDELNLLKDETLCNLLERTLAPAALTGHLLDDWPIIPSDWGGGCRFDALWAKNICHFLGFKQVDYLQYAEKARRLTDDARYCRLLLALTDELEACEGLLVRSEIAEVAREVGV